MKKDYQELLNLIDYLIKNNDNATLKLDKAIEVIPELSAFKTCLCKHSAHKHDNIFNHSLEALINVEKYLDKSNFSNEEIDLMHISLLLHDIGKTVTRSFDEDGVTHFHDHPHQSALITKNILNRYIIDEQKKIIIINLVEYHDDSMNPINKDELPNMINTIGIDQVKLLLKIQRADLNAHSDWYANKHKTALDEIEKQYKELCN